MTDRRGRRGTVAILGAVLAAGLSVPFAASASARTLLRSDTGSGYRPASFCPANHTCFTHAHWTRWGHTAMASAHGVTEYPDGPAHSGRALVILYRPRALCGAALYTRAKWRYPALGYPAHGAWITSEYLPSLSGQSCAVSLWTGA